MKKLIIILIFTFVLTGCHQEFGKSKIEKTKPQYITAPENNTYKIGVDNFQTEIKTDITADSSLQYKIGDKYISFRPMMARFDNDFDNIKEPTANTHKIAKKKEWKNVFGNNINLKLETSSRVWHKEVIIKSLKTLGEIPKDAEFLEIWFEVKTNMVIDGWDKESKFYLSTSTPTRLGDYSYIDPPMAWDSAATSSRIKVKSYLIGTDKLYYIKQIPTDWLKKAEYPVSTDADITYGTASKFHAGSIVLVSVIYNDDNEFFVCYADDINDNGNCWGATITGTSTISWGGSESDKFAEDCFQAGLGTLDSCKIDTDKFAVAYADMTAGSDGFTRVGTTTGTTFNGFGTAVEFENADAENIACVGLSTTKYVICYDDESNSDTATCVVCDITGDSAVSCGTPDEVDGNDGTTDYYPKTTAVDKIGTNSFVVCFEGEDVDDVFCQTASVSDTNFTWGTAIAVRESTRVDYIDVVSPDTDSFVVMWRNNQLGISGGEMVACTVNAGIITCGDVSWVYGDGYGTAQNKMAVIDSTHVVGAFSLNTGTPDDAIGWSEYFETTFDDRVVSTTSVKMFDNTAVGGSVDYGLDTDYIAADKFVICYQDDDNSADGYCIIGETPSAVEEAARRIFTVY